MHDLELLKTDYWTVLLIDDQAYLGRSVISANRDVGSLAELTLEEWTDFYGIVARLETAFKKGFDATMFNWSSLMNSAYKSENPEPHVHWHFRPRYNHDVELAGELFQDTEFAYHYDRTRRKSVSKELLEEIAKKVRPYL